MLVSVCLSCTYRISAVGQLKGHCDQGEMMSTTVDKLPPFYVLLSYFLFLTLTPSLLLNSFENNLLFVFILFLMVQIVNL